MRRIGAVEAAIRKLVGKRPFQAMLDLGTGTGRLLEILAPLYRRGVGIDMSREMLAVARANLDRAGVHNAQVRQGDIYAPPVERDAFDLVTIHQVLHYLDDPAAGDPRGGAHAAARRPADRSSTSPPHALEFLREAHAHVRLGFSDRQIADWFAEAGLDLEETLEFEPRGDADRALTVKLWLGRDRRLLVADPQQSDLAKGDRLMSQFRFSRRPHIGDKVHVSFEFFPPKTDEMEARLWDTVTGCSR